jgi:hypothetical protein
MLKKSADEFLGIPGGYFLKDDGTAMNAFGQPVPVRTDEELQQYSLYRPKGGSRAPARPAAPIVAESIGVEP